jgi:HK97 family phage portal protein
MAFRPFSAVKFAVATIARSMGSVWTRMGGQGLGSRLRYLVPGSRVDYEREAGNLWQNSIVAIALKWLGDNYPKPIMRVSAIGRDGRYRPLPRHKVCDLMKRPNPFYTGRVLSKAIALSLVTDGNAFVVKIRNAIGQPVQLWWVPHWWIQPVWDSYEGAPYIRAYQFLRDYEIYEIPYHDVIHIRDGLDPWNDRLGLAALKSQVREVVADNEQAGYTVSILRNMGVPGLVAIPKNGARMTSEQANRLKERIRDNLTGDSRGETMVQLTGDVEIVQLGHSPEEMRLDKLPARSEARICAAIGVSPMVLGMPDPNKTYSNYKEANTAAWRHCIVPMQDLVAEALTYGLLNEFDDPERNIVEYDYTHVEALQEDLGEKHDRVRKDFAGNLITQNEGRDELGYEPLPDGDRLWYEITAVNKPDTDPVEDDTQDLPAAA